MIFRASDVQLASNPAPRAPLKPSNRMVGNDAHFGSSIHCPARPVAVGAQAWWNDEWQLRKKITIDSSASGANVT